MIDVSREGRELLRALVAAPRAWQTPAELSRRLGRDLDETTDLLCELDLAGWLALWEDESGLRVTLSPRAADRLDVRLAGAAPQDEARAQGRRPQPPPRWRPADVNLALASALVDAGLPSRPGPQPGDDPSAACPTCGSERLGPQRYCLYCDRWDAGAPDLSAHNPATAPTRPSRRRRRRRRNPQTALPSGSRPQEHDRSLPV